MAFTHRGFEPQGPAIPAAAGSGALRPALLWRAALEAACRELEAGGLSCEAALEHAEGAMIACALKHEPRSFKEALDLLMREVEAVPLA